MKTKIEARAFSIVEVATVMAIILIILIIVVPNLQRQRIISNEMSARETLKAISSSLESYASMNNGIFPTQESFLTAGTHPYLSRSYQNQVIRGYTYHYILSTTGYTIAAIKFPYEPGTRWFQIASSNRTMQENIKTSCPFVYAWDGNEFRLVSDTLSFSRLDHPANIAGQTIRFDLEDFIKIDFNLMPKDGYFIVKYLNNLNETVYIDESKLLVVDHPDDIVILPDNIAQYLPWVPDTKIYQVKDAAPPVSAINQDGQDILNYIKEWDGLCVPVEQTDKKGIIKPLTMFLDLGDLSRAKQIQLIVRGYFTPGMFRSIYTYLMKQQGVAVNFPFIEIIDKQGMWQKLFISKFL